jgi:hypothetical protein
MPDYDFNREIGVFQVCMPVSLLSSIVFISWSRNMFEYRKS